MRRNIVNVMFGMFIVAAFGLSACATITIPVNYIPQNSTRYDGNVSIGEFKYLPADRGEVEQSEIQFNRYGNHIYISANVAHLVKRATGLELEKTGIKIDNDNALSLSGNVLEFRANVEGSKATWTYSILYKIIRKNDGQVIYENTYIADPVISGRQGVASDLSPFVNELIMSGFNKFISDNEVRKIFTKGN